MISKGLEDFVLWGSVSSVIEVILRQDSISWRRSKAPPSGAAREDRIAGAPSPRIVEIGRAMSCQHGSRPP
jgi:hypothetical protein